MEEEIFKCVPGIEYYSPCPCLVPSTPKSYWVADKVRRNAAEQGTREHREKKEEAEGEETLEKERKRHKIYRGSGVLAANPCMMEWRRGRARGLAELAPRGWTQVRMRNRLGSPSNGCTSKAT